MSAAAPWSVKGIDPKAREIAKDLARREGMTLGEWLNTRIMVEGGEEDYVPLSNDRRSARRPDDFEATRESAQRLNSVVSELGERLEAAERRSASAIQGVDQAVASIMRRLDMDRDDESRQGRRLDDISREMREGHLRLQRLEAAASEAQLNGQATTALQERLDRAQEATSVALKDLERSFAALDQRIGTGVGSGVDAASLSKLAEDLTQEIEANRLDMMRRIDAATDTRRVARIEQALNQLTAHTKAAELRSASAVEAMGQQVMNIARNMHTRMQSLEERGNDAEALQATLDQRIDQRLLEVGRTLDEKLDREIARHSASLDARMTRQEDDHALALERLGGEITRISDRLSERITQTERRSSQAIDDIGRRLTESTEKFERRHEDTSGELAERVRQSEERTRQLLEEAKEARAARESAALNAAPRLTASLPPQEDDLGFAPMPQSGNGLPPTDSLFGADDNSWTTREVLSTDWRATAFGSSRDLPLADAQATPDWADTAASEMSVEPFPSVDSLRPFGTLDGDLTDSLDDDFALLEAGDPAPAVAEETAPAYADEFPSIFASSEEPEIVTEEQQAEIMANAEAPEAQSMTFDAQVEEDTSDYDPLNAPLHDDVADDHNSLTASFFNTRDAIDSARAAIADEDPGVAARSTFGLKKNRKGGKSQLQEKLDRKASRDGSTFGNALKASALAMLVVGGGGYATLKLAKDQNLNLNFGVDMIPGEEAPPIAALALDATPTEAVPSAQVVATEGAAVYERAIGLLDNGDPSGLEPLQRSAELGYVPAQLRLATLFTEGGPGIEANLVEARAWTRRAAEAGDARAMQHYATQLYDGVGGAADEAGALEWMRKSAEAGRVDAQYNLAHLYESGIKGMRPDKVEAFTWYMIAARRGDQQALESVQRLTPDLSAPQRKRATDGADSFNVQPLA